MVFLKLKKVFRLWGLVLFIGCVISSCDKSRLTSSSFMPGVDKQINIIVLPVADYCGGFRHDIDLQRQTALNNVIFTRLNLAGVCSYSREELIRWLLKEGILGAKSGTEDIDFFESGQWNETTETMVTSINPLLTPTSLTKPQIPLDRQRIFSLGQMFKADYVFRGRIIKSGRPGIDDQPSRNNKILVFNLNLNKQPVTLFAQAKMYDLPLAEPEKQARGNKAELQLFLQETKSGNVVWQGRTEVPAAGFNAPEISRRSTRKLRESAGELLADLIRQTAYSGYSGPGDYEDLLPEETKPGEPLPEPYPAL